MSTGAAAPLCSQSTNTPYRASQSCLLLVLTLSCLLATPLTAYAAQKPKPPKPFPVTNPSWNVSSSAATPGPSSWLSYFLPSIFPAAHPPPLDPNSATSAHYAGTRKAAAQLRQLLRPVMRLNLPASEVRQQYRRHFGATAARLLDDSRAEAAEQPQPWHQQTTRLFSRASRSRSALGDDQQLPEIPELSRLLDVATEQLLSGSNVLPCNHTVNHEQDFPPSNRTAKYAIAVNLHSSGDVLPNMIFQFMHLVLWLPEGGSYFSIYESGSQDDTIAWLDLLQVLLQPLRIPFNITVDGALSKAPREERIHFLAKIRNQAIEPIVEAHETGRFKSDFIFFINDIFFCHADVIRLMQYKADMTCGMDFFTPRPKDGQEIPMAHLMPDIDASALPDIPGLLWPKALFSGMKQTELDLDAEDSGVMLHSRQDRRRLLHESMDHTFVFDHLRLMFYDKWVSRDIEGNKINNVSPYSTHALTESRIQGGRPLPVYCCWNGMVVLNVQPFLGGMRFRSHLKGECSASECSLMCDDFHRLGYSNIVMDPGVRVAYSYSQTFRLFGPQVENIRPTNWSEVSREIDYLLRPQLVDVIEYDNVACCDLRPGKLSVNFRKDCHRIDVMKTNYTARYLRVLNMKSSRKFGGGQYGSSATGSSKYGQSQYEISTSGSSNSKYMLGSLSTSGSGHGQGKKKSQIKGQQYQRTGWEDGQDESFNQTALFQRQQQREQRQQRQQQRRERDRDTAGPGKRHQQHQQQQQDDHQLWGDGFQDQQ